MSEAGLIEKGVQPMAGTQNPRQEVRTRLVLNFPGFEQTDSEAQIGRLKYGADITGKNWGFQITQDSLVPARNAHHTNVAFETNGGNWKTHTDLVQFRWNDIVHAYEKDPFPGGFLKNTRKYLAFFADGTVGKYRKASARYWGFTIFPILLAILFAAITGAVLWWFSAPWWLHLGVIPIATLILCKWPGDKLYVPLTIADWGFARDMIHQSNPDIEARFEEFGKTVSEAISSSDHDEIIIVGHSFGSLWAVAALSNAINANAKLLQGKNVRFLALGSSMLKIALAPEATFMREHWGRVMDQEDLFWHEVQTKDDLIAFYPCDPFQEVGITNPKTAYKISQIRFGKGMARKRYRAIRKSFYRTHRQYILYYDKRVYFDYMLRLFGPFSVKTIADDKAVVNHIDHDGRLI